MIISIREVKNRSELRKFIHLPAKIHKDHATWLPNIYRDEWNYFSPKKNPSFGNTETILALAYKGKTAVGRIMGIIHHHYNEIRNEKTARFCFLECYQEQECTHELLQYVENWAKTKGMLRMVGPYGFSDKDPQGLLIQGFEYSPLISSPCNFPYLVNLVEKEGYKKEIDCLACLYDFKTPLPDVYRKISHRIQVNKSYHLVEFTNKNQMKPYILPLFQLMNVTYTNLYGFVPLNDKEITAMAKRYMPILDPRFIKIVTQNDKMLGFIIAIPHLSEGIQKSKGYLFPIGIFHIIRASRKTKLLDLMLGAVHPEYQGLGIEVIMAQAILDSAKKANYKSIEVHLMLETNTPVLREMERVKAIIHKRFRVYYKNLYEQ